MAIRAVRVGMGLSLAAATALGLGGCSLLGVTASNAIAPYPTKDATRQRVKLVFPQLPGSSKATFRVRNAPSNAKEGFGYTDPAPDQSPAGHAAGTLCESVSPGNYCVELDPARLPENIYLVDVYLDDDLNQARGTLAFVAPVPEAAAAASRAGYVVSDLQGEP